MTYYDDLGNSAGDNNGIDPRFYSLFHVKRGLRNQDGSGVLVGLTTVSTVMGYQKVDEDVVPIPGKLFYRGIDVESLVKGSEAEGRFGFEETIYLLLFGTLPSTDELKTFTETLGELRMLPKNFTRDVLMTFRTPDIMNSLGRSVMTLYGRDPEPDNLSVPNQVRQSMELIAKVQPLVPWAYWAIQSGYHNNSLIIHTPDPALSSAENVLRLLRPDGQYTPLEAKTLDIALILHAEHGGGNNSTFTMRVVSSSGTDIYSAATAAVGSLKGPLHGGANVRVVGMMEDVQKTLSDWTSKDQIRAYIEKLLRGETYDGAGKLYGFGHAVYTVSDPRAIVLREYARLLSIEKGREEEFELYKAFEAEAPDVLKGIKKNTKGAVCSNVDFYSGFVYDCLGIPTEVFTPLFAMSRMAGWAAHRIELMTNPLKIVRPAFKYIGQREKAYTPLVERDEA
jgi:citrate synthase